MVFRYFTFILCSMMILTACASDSEKRDDYFEKGLSYVEEGKFKAALLEFKNSVKIDPAFTKGWREIANLSSRQGDLKGAFRAYLKVAEKDPRHSEAHFHLARLYMLAKKGTEARSHIDKALVISPENIEYMLISAAVFSLEEHEEKALELYNEVLKREKNDIRPLLGVAQIKSRAKNFAGAEDSLREAISIDPKAIRPRLNLVNLLNESLQYDKAEIEMTALVDKNRDNIGLLIVMGDFYMAHKKYSEAEAVYRDASTREPSALRPVMKLAFFYDQRGAFVNAEAMYLKAMELKPDDSDVTVSVARFYLNRGDFVKTGEMIAGVLDKNPGFLPALMARGEMALRQRQFGAALETFTEVVRVDARNITGAYFKGISEMALGQNDRARKDMLKVLALEPEHLKAQIALAELYLKDRELTLAKESLEKVLAKAPHLYKPNLLMGDVLASMGDYERAQKIYTRLKEQNPKDPIPFYHSGILYMAKGELDLAMKDFTLARAMAPKSMEIFRAIFRCYAMENKSKEALAVCLDQLKVVEAVPAMSAMVYEMMGRLYTRMGSLEKAEAAYFTAIEKNPDTTRPYYGLAAVYQRQGTPEKVMAQLRGVIEKNQNDPLPHVLMGIMSEGKGDIEDAKAAYRKALAVKNDIVAAANNLAYILADANEDIDEALSLARMAKGKAINNPNIMDTLGLVYYRKGLYESGISEFKESLEKLPENATVNYHLGLALYASGDVEKAKVSLGKALALSSDFKGADEARAILARK